MRRGTDRGVYRPLTPTTATDTKFGWQEIGGLLRSFANPVQGLAKLALSIKRPGKPKGYDRFVNVHGPSVTVLIRRMGADGRERYAFVDMERAYRPRLRSALFPVDGRGYIQRLLEDNLWHTLMESPGTICRELVGGMVDASDFQHIPDQSYEDCVYYAVMRAAIREAKQETGLKVEIEEVFVDRVCPDPAHSLHPQSIAIARAVGEGEQELDENEAAKKVVWLTLDEIMDQIGHGEIDDGRVIGALFYAELLAPVSTR